MTTIGGGAEAQAREGSELSRELVIEKQTGVQALSPTGVPLDQEMEAR